jgi:Holliday junction DNA helicase RuvB
MAVKAKSDVDRLLTPERSEDDTLEASLRPKRLADFVGQQQACENLSIFIQAAKTRQEALDHVLFSGPRGLGKTTLAQIVARELGVNFRSTSGPVLAKAGDLAAILTNLEPRDVLFIDEITASIPRSKRSSLSGDGGLRTRSRHRRGTVCALRQDHAQSLHTRRRHHALRPHHDSLRDRFGIPVRLNFYSPEELLSIVERGARVLGLMLTADGARDRRSRRGTPRIAGRLLKRVRDIASVANHKTVDARIADQALTQLKSITVA